MPATSTTTRLERALPGLRYYPETQPDELPARVSDAEAILAEQGEARCARPGRQGAGPACLICPARVTGTDNVDLRAPRRRATSPCATCARAARCPSCSTCTRFILALTQSSSPRSPRGAAVRRLGLERAASASLDFPSASFWQAKTLGIVGHGELGRGVARVGAALGMRVLIAARRGARPAGDHIAFDEVLARADVLSLHCPLTPGDARLIPIGAAELRCAHARRCAADQHRTRRAQ